MNHNIFTIITFVMVGFGIIAFIFGNIYVIKSQKSIIERARKIDPSVKTLAEADYVLKKDIAKEIGSDKKNK